MSIGQRIAGRRKELGLTQEELASQVFVTTQAVSQWENDKTTPDPANYSRIADALQLTVSELLASDFSEDFPGPDWTIREKMFSETHMYTRLKTLSEAEHLVQTDKALSYAQEKHANAYRKPTRFHKDSQVPYIIHPLMMACHAHALGIRDDAVLAVIMLHDVCEDCGVIPEELPFPENIRHSVSLLTKEKGQPTEEYYAGVMSDSCACIVKALDRCNNVATMASSFSKKKLIEYVNETEQYVYPLLDHIKREYLGYRDVIFVIKYQLLSTIETIKALLIP